MTFNLIGLGLTTRSLSLEAAEVLKGCDKIYLESYTVNFPYSMEKLKEDIGFDFEILDRGPVEDEHLVKEAEEKDTALLVYGDCLSATTHTQLVLACHHASVECNVYQNASIILAIAQTGLQLYKFGKTPSMPKWQKNFEPTSFLDYYLENQKNKAHTLLLTDIGLGLDEALEQFEKACKDKECEIDKLIVITHAGTKEQKFYYDSLENLKGKDVSMPFCLILPSDMHHIEAEAVEELKEK